MAEGVNISKLNKIEQRFNEFKERIASEGIEDETLQIFINQLESELGKIKKGLPEASMERAEALIENIEQRFSEIGHSDALAELRARIRKKPEEQAVPEEREEAPEEKAEVAEERAEEPERETVEEVPEQEAEEAAEREEQAEEIVSAPEAEKLEAEQEEVEQPEEIKAVEESGVKAELDWSAMDELAEESVNIILQAQLESGGILTTLSDERLHYIYPRAHLLGTLGLIYAGKFEEAKKALEFAFHGQNRRTGSLPQRWDVNGNDASYRRVEVDATALFLYTFAEYVKKSADYEFAEHYWERVEKAVDFINSKIVPGKNLVLTPNSIHEYAPIDNGYEIWCNALCCAAFRELSSIAEKIRLQYAPLEKENMIKEAIMSYMWNTRINSFIKTIKVEDAIGVILGPDASTLALAFFNVFADKDERIKGTIRFLEENLKYEALGGLCDYAEQYGREYSGIGANPFFTLMLADHYICIGDRAKAEKYLRWILSVATEKKLPKYVATKEDFEALVSDLNDAGLLDRDLMKLIEATRKHADYANGIAHILEPYIPAHAMLIVVWNRFKEKFKEQ